MKVAERLLLEQVLEIISRYNMFARGHRVGVAVSGGADSVGLLHVLNDLAPRWDLSLRVLHLDHQLRGAESLRDAEFVRRLAADLGLPFCLEQIDVRAFAERTGDNLEQAGRSARREFLLRFLRSGELDRVAMGHTLSDQAETVLFRFLRGAGAAGLSAIHPVTPEGLIRPLLEVERRRVEDFLRTRGIAWIEDSTNQDLSFARNRIRRQLLPQLAREWNPNLPRVLARTAALARDEEIYWKGEVDRLFPQVFAVEGLTVAFPWETMQTLPRAVARRLIRRAMETVKGDLRRIDFAHVEAVVELSVGLRKHGRVRLPGVDAVRSFGWVRLAPSAYHQLEKEGYRIPLTGSGQFAIPGGLTEICLEVFETKEEKLHQASCTNPGYTIRHSELDWDQVSGSLELRNWRPGDHYRRSGHTSHEKIKILFQLARIPFWERRLWPIITSGKSIVWTRRFGVADGFEARPDSRAVLRVQEQSKSH